MVKKTVTMLFLPIFLFTGCMAAPSQPIEMSSGETVSSASDAPETFSERLPAGASAEYTKKLGLKPAVPGPEKNLFPALDESGKTIYINRRGETEPGIAYDDLTYFSEGLAIATDGNDRFYINTTGERQFGESIQAVTLFQNGRAAVRYMAEEGIYIIDQSGAVYAWLENAYSINEYSEGYAIVRTAEGYAFIDWYGTYLTELFFLRAEAFSEGLATVYTKEAGVLQYMDTAGEIVIDTGETQDSFEYIDVSFHEGFACLPRGGYIDKTGKKVLEQTGGPFSEGLASFDDDGKIGFINSHGEVVIPAKYDSPSGYSSIFSEGYAMVEMDGKLGFIYRVLTKV